LVTVLAGSTITTTLIGLEFKSPVYTYQLLLQPESSDSGIIISTNMENVKMKDAVLER